MRRTLLSLMLPLAILPAGWPHHFALGVADPPGDARALRAHAPVDMRYQYLAGGVNTGHGWSTWNPGGSFVSIWATRVFVGLSPAGIADVTGIGLNAQVFAFTSVLAMCAAM